MKNQMHTTAKHLTRHGNLALVQLRMDPLSLFAFRPGGPELQCGGLEISESSGQGVVGQLMAVNNTKDHLLLTDADVLVGAKQNRVLNKSVLLAPLSKTLIEVSCVERLRWHYTSEHFINPSSVADIDLRKSKMSPMFFDPDEVRMSDSGTQKRVWDCVHNSLNEAGVHSHTESYEELAAHQAEKMTGIPDCEPAPECNALVILSDRKVVSMDLFGNEDSFRHYFPLLRDAAFRSAPGGAAQIDPHEAYYKACDAVDNFLEAKRIKEESYSGTGLMELAADGNLSGFILTIQGQLVHGAGFGKK
jgi:hypothetical protein